MYQNVWELEAVWLAFKTLKKKENEKTYGAFLFSINQAPVVPIKIQHTGVSILSFPFISSVFPSFPKTSPHPPKIGLYD